MAITPEGRALLSKPELISKIEAHALNAVVAQGLRKGESALFWFASTPEGRVLLERPEITAKIRAETLFSVVETGIHKGKQAIGFIYPNSPKLFAQLEKLKIITPQPYPLQPNKNLAASFYPSPSGKNSFHPQNSMLIMPPTQTSSSAFQPHRNSPPLVIPAPQGPNTIGPSTSSNILVPASASNHSSISSEYTNLLQRRLDDKDELIAALKAQLQDKEKLITMKDDYIEQLKKQLVEFSAKRKIDANVQNDDTNLNKRKKP
ncbi:MAG: hypothetical protein JWM09_678 [Francisellaceae bacterium]|nr:hypothetical protein [Francisellaceae bacterium]